MGTKHRRRQRGMRDSVAILSVVVGSPHTAEEAEEALRRGLIPIERWTAGDGREIEGGVRMDGKIIGYGRVVTKTGRPIQCRKILVGREETMLLR
jgi:hypothetical protein